MPLCLREKIKDISSQRHCSSQDNVFKSMFLAVKLDNAFCMRI